MTPLPNPLHAPAPKPQTLCFLKTGSLPPFSIPSWHTPYHHPPLPPQAWGPVANRVEQEQAAQRQEWEISGREGGRDWGSAGASGFLKFKLLSDQYKSRTRCWLLHGFIALKTCLVRDSYINFTLLNIYPYVCRKLGAIFQVEC